MELAALALSAEAPRPAAHARESSEHQVGGRVDVSPIGVPLARIDQQHLTSADLSGFRPVVEVQAPFGDDQGDRYRVPMLGHFLARLEAQANDPHRPAVGDLLKAKGTMLVARR